MKKCFVCQIEKELSEFYAHPRMGDRHLNKCKDCTKRQSDEREKKLRLNPEWSEKERLRSKEKYYRLNYRERQYELNKLSPYKTNQYKNLHRNMNLSVGEISHHWNYNFMKDVIILDIKFHRFIHRYLIFDKETLCFKTIEGKLLSTKKKHLDYLNLLKPLLQ